MSIVVPQLAQPAGGQPAQQPANRNAELIDRNRERRQGGLGELRDEELSNVLGRLEQGDVRTAQFEQLDAFLDDGRAQADALENSLRSAGLSNVANQTQRALRRGSFNNARRGLAGGSVAAQQESNRIAEANQQADQVTQQAKQASTQQFLKTQQQRDKLAQTIASQDPFLAQQEQFRLGDLQRENSLADFLRQLQSQSQAAGVGGQAGLGGALAGTLGSLGGVFGGALAGGA